MKTLEGEYTMGDCDVIALSYLLVKKTIQNPQFFQDRGPVRPNMSRTKPLKRTVRGDFNVSDGI